MIYKQDSQRYLISTIINYKRTAVVINLFTSFTMQWVRGEVTIELNMIEWFIREIHKDITFK